MTIAAIIVAAGRGTRASGALSTAIPAKQYAEIAGRTVLARAADAFLTHERIGLVQIVIHADDRAHYDKAIHGAPQAAKLAPPVTGGATRQASVRAGIEALAAMPHPPRHVLIHDAARPFVTAASIDRVISGLETHEAVIAGLQVADTLKRTDASGRIIATVPRDNLWRAQTPQGFAASAILAAHRAAAAAKEEEFTDDAALCEWHGQPVHLVAGDAVNQKLTTAEDFTMAHQLLASETGPDIRVGNGFDVHRFTTGNHVWLCGVKFVHTHGVEAHSDGDVALHALTDALLGAIGDGDIGLHFKNTDPRWKDAASDLFLADAARRVRARNGRISSVDVTILCEAPKIGPHRDAMRQRIADILAIAIDRVGVKATTTEQMGFTGRREGLAAIATATVILS